MSERTIEVEIRGVSPLLMNRPDLLDLSDKAKVRQAGKNEAEIQFASKKYLTPEGELFTPSTHIYGALVEGGKSVKVKGSGKATYSKLIGSCVRVEPAQIIHLNQKVEPITTISVNPATKGRNPLTRPILNKWGLKFELVFDADEIPEEALRECLDIAGKRAGIGDWRPQKKGPYGRFQVVSWKEKK